MDINGTEWITLREAEQIIGRSRRQIWRYIDDGSWDTHTITDNMNRQVTYIKVADILRKKAENEAASNLNLTHISESVTAAGKENDASAALTQIQKLLERLTASQESQNVLIKKCVYMLERIHLTSIRVLMVVIVIGIVIVAVCSILNVVGD